MPPFRQILLIDDDNITNFLNKKLLQKLQLSDDIVITLNGEEALHYLHNCTNMPELILLDINMPIMNGFEFLEASENLIFNGRRKVKVFMLSTSTNTLDLNQLKKYKISGYINKPLTIEKLETVWRK